MKCSQCDRPAFKIWGDKPGVALCLDCSHKYSDMLYKDSLQNMAMMNQVLDDMDMAVPVALGGGRFPVAALARAASRPDTYNNISIANSQVGVLNTGHLAKIDAAVTMARGSDAEEVGSLVATLTEKIVSAMEAGEKRSELIELLQGLSSEVVGQRKAAVTQSLAKTIFERVSKIAPLAPLAERLLRAVTELSG